MANAVYTVEILHFHYVVEAKWVAVTIAMRAGEDVIVDHQIVAYEPRFTPDGDGEPLPLPKAA